MVLSYSPYIRQDFSWIIPLKDIDKTMFGKSCETGNDYEGKTHRAETDNVKNRESMGKKAYPYA